jgi:hypothetical protein
MAVLVFMIYSIIAIFFMLIYTLTLSKSKALLIVPSISLIVSESSNRLFRFWTPIQSLSVFDDASMGYIKLNEYLGSALKILVVGLVFIVIMNLFFKTKDILLKC